MTHPEIRAWPATGERTVKRDKAYVLQTLGLRDGVQPVVLAPTRLGLVDR